MRQYVLLRTPDRGTPQSELSSVCCPCGFAFPGRGLYSMWSSVFDVTPSVTLPARSSVAMHVCVSCFLSAPWLPPRAPGMGLPPRAEASVTSAVLSLRPGWLCVEQRVTALVPTVAVSPCDGPCPPAPLGCCWPLHLSCCLWFRANPRCRQTHRPPFPASRLGRAWQGRPFLQTLKCVRLPLLGFLGSTGIYLGTES